MMGNLVSTICFIALIAMLMADGLIYPALALGIVFGLILSIQSEY